MTVFLCVVDSVGIWEAMDYRINVVRPDAVNEGVDFLEVRMKTVSNALNKKEITKTLLLYLNLERFTQPLSIRHIDFLSASRKLFILGFSMIYMNPSFGSLVKRLKSLSMASSI